MVALEVAMMEHSINLDSSSDSTIRGHSLCAFLFSFNASSSSSSNEWLIDFGASYHMANDKAIISTMNECNTKQIFVGDDRSINVVGDRVFMLINDVLCVLTIF